jgi:hypothetical protein
VVLACNTVIDVRPYQYEVNIFGGILVSALVFFLSALWPEKDPRAIERIDAFAADLRTPVTGGALSGTGTRFTRTSSSAS